jgi:hypothetical protein
MIARIYKPAKNAMQSGAGRNKFWLLDYEPSEPCTVEPLMGWTSSTDMRQQVQLRFATKEEAIAYCESNNIPYEVHEPHQASRRTVAYSDNFAFTRRNPWTH